MSSVNWDFINNEISLHHTAQINTLSKENLIAVNQRFRILANDNFTVDHLRKTLTKCVKKIIAKNTKSEYCNTSLNNRMEQSEVSLSRDDHDSKSKEEQSSKNIVKSESIDTKKIKSQ